MLRVFICGAHSTGKTTLQNRLSNEKLSRKFHNVEEIAQRILNQCGRQASDFDPREDPEEFYILQLKILQAQMHEDEELSRENTSYISDRGLDPIIYCKMYLNDEKFRTFMETREAKKSIEMHQASNTLTVILKPHAECVEENRRRMVPRMDELVQFTELFEQFLKDHNIHYHVIEELCLETRVANLKFLIKKAIKEMYSSHD